jgi:glycosyltransferase involved in cell wall biosynthesis
MDQIDWLITQLSVIGGAEKFVNNVVPHLSNMDWKIRVISLIQDSFFVDQLRANNIPVIELASSAQNPTIIINRLLKEWKKEPPKIVHTHLYHAGILGRVCAKFSGIKYVIVHQQGPEQNRSSLRTLLDRVTHRLVTRYVCSCEAVANVLVERERIPRSKISIIYNCIKPNLQVSSTIKPDGWPVPPGKKCIGSISRLSTEKGHFFLIQAIAKMVNQGYDIFGVFLGEGGLRSKLIQQTSELAIKDRVFFLGNIDNVYPWLKQFDIFILPSLWEGIPLALLEAMSIGLPVIASNVGGIPEIIQKPEFGLLVPPQDSDALAENIINLLNNQHLRKMIGESGRKHVLDNFSIDATVNKLDQLYKYILSSDGD